MRICAKGSPSTQLVPVRSCDRKASSTLPDADSEDMFQFAENFCSTTRAASQ